MSGDVGAEVAAVLCAHHARHRIVGSGVRIEHLAPGEATPCASCRAAARALAPLIAKRVEAATMAVNKVWSRRLATEVEEAKAEAAQAWDEGWLTGNRWAFSEADADDIRTNPYRAAALDPGQPR